VELQDHPDEPPEPVVGGVPDRSESGPQPVEEVPRRRRPSTVGGVVYLVVLAGAGAGVAVVSDGRWRLGVKWISASLLFAAVARLALPSREAGMLAVRRRLIDVTLLTAVGVALWFLSTSIPNQPLP
jgi:hypothetical protein